MATAGSTVSVAAELARPFPLKLVIDELVERHGGTTFTVTADDAVFAAGVAGLVMAIAAVDAGATYVADLRLQRSAVRIVHRLRDAVYEHLQRLALTFHQRRPTGDLVTRVTGDVNAVGELFSTSLGTLASSVLLLVGMLVVSLVIDPVLALAAFSVVPLVSLATVRSRRLLKAAARRQREKEGEIASLATEALGAMREVKALGAEQYERRRLVDRSTEVREAGLEAAHVERRFSSVIDLAGAVGTGLVLGLGVFRVASGALTPGDLVVFNSYVRRLYRPLRDIARQASRVARSMARVDRIADVLAADDVLDERRGAAGEGRARGELEVDGVSFAYAGGRPALHHVSLQVLAGERVAVVGASGAGKSTLMSLLVRFHDPASGRVLLDGRDLRDVGLDWLRRQIGIVLQDTVLFTGTVSDNIAYGVEADTRAIRAAARAAGAEEFVARLPDGFDTVLGPRGVGLSGGQRQRIAIARTLLRNPPVLILDEPTAGLDQASAGAVLQGLDVLMKGRTVLIVTHDLALAGTAHRVVVLEGGTVVAEGSPGVVLREPAWAALATAAWEPAP